MPFPIDQSAMFEHGYVYARWEPCSVCGLLVEVWTTPGKREIQMEPMVSSTSPATRHYERCNIAPKGEPSGRSENIAGRDSNSGAQLPADSSGKHRPAGNDAVGCGESGVQVGGCDARSAEIKLYGVTDRNMLAVGWQDGTLKVQFKFGAYLYSNVPENMFVTLRKVPYPNAYFTKAIKNHPELYPFTKVG